jgi:hypothetical protein
MSFHTVESFVRGEWDDPSRCEDLIVTTEHFAAVIDGATTAPGLTIEGMSPGRFAALVGKSALELLSPDATAAEAVAAMSYRLAAELAALRPSPRAQARAIFGFVVYSAVRKEIWRVAECYFAWEGYLNAPRLQAERVSIEAGAMLLRTLILTGSSPEELLANDPATQMIAPLIEAHHAVRDRPGTPWSFGAIDGQPVPDEFVEIFKVPEHILEIILASDGWPELHPALAESEAFTPSAQSSHRRERYGCSGKLHNSTDQHRGAKADGPAVQQSEHTAQ